MWQLANDIVRNWEDASYSNESAVGTVVEDLLGLTKLMLEHQVSSEAIAAADNEVLEQLAQMSGATNPEVRKVAKVLSQRTALLPVSYTHLTLPTKRIV